ncbi:MAG: oxidoreductase [Gammaproteobacteria bacterium]|nr:oxidoreductase [Gammaproteobacteria bacterium]
MSQQRPLELVAKRELAPNTLSLQFRFIDGESFAYTPGHFVSLHFDYRGEPVRRSYSIATRNETPDAATELEFAISYVEGGKASDYFFAAEPGTRIGVSGPFGLLLLPDTLPERTFLIATGTGVAPYRAMLPRLAEELRAHPERQVVLLFGCRTRAERLYAEEFQAFAAQHPNFRYLACLSREEPQGERERHGHVQSALAEFAPVPERDMVYLCGNPPMVDEVFNALKEKGFGVKNVRREKYVFSAK